MITKSPLSGVLYRLVGTMLVWSAMVFPAGAVADTESQYEIQPGDFLRVSVWKEEDLQQELLVAPDGSVSFPLVGRLQASGRTVTDLQSEMVGRIEKYIPDPVITIQVIQTEGNSIYVLGKVNRPGVYVMNRPLDVMQALALAGGLAVFADQNEISVLRRDDGGQSAVSFRYGDVQYGRNLEQNVLLRPGDVVVVP